MREQRVGRSRLAEVVVGVISRIGIVGCGVMGAGIAETCARADLDVVVAVSSPQAAEHGRRRLVKSLERLERRGKIDALRRDRILDRIRLVTHIEELADRQLVIEAVTENEPTKLKIFSTLDSSLEDSGAILASNTSSIPIARLAKATSRPEYVIGAHFFNPAQAMPLVELAGSLLTGERTYHQMSAFVVNVLGKQVVRAPDRAGFLVNALLIPYLLAAIRMVESGIASAEDIDRAMELGCSHPMGPLKLTDLVGLDVVASVAESLYAEFRDNRYSPPPLLMRMVEAELLGRKVGCGFYDNY